MKKTTLASALLLTMLSSSAMALPIYSEGGTSLDLYGRFGAYFGKTQDTNTDLFDDESRIGLKVTHEINSDLSALGGVEFRFADSEKRFSDPTTHDAYVGLKYKPLGAITFGSQSTTADDIALSKYAYSSENITKLPTHGERTIKIRTTDFGNDSLGYFAFGADHTFMGENDKSVDVRSRSTGAGGFYHNQWGDLGFKFNGGYAQTETKYDLVANTKDVHKAWMLGSEFTYQNWALGLDYSQSREHLKYKTTGVTTEPVREDAFQVALKYGVTPDTNIFGSYQYNKERITTDMKNRSHQYTVGVDHKLHKNVIAYAQVDTVRSRDYAGEKETDVGGAIGMRVFF